MRSRRHTTSQRLRALPLLLGRSTRPQPLPREVLDDALLGSDWRWDDERPTLNPS
ncbi:MAG: hypothetical protein H6712_25970 [Myxococcales bacterium]|nr:hypothetical protein [Myxococcales bacterium]MCB9717323.1 hypothetical protein [Myxococcales bacterium]